MKSLICILYFYLIRTLFVKQNIKLIATTSSAILLSFPGYTRTQIIPDGTTPTVPTACISTCNITGGTQAGVNLFHSFSQFNVDVGQQVNFIDSGATNIITRVTGGNPSNILGSLGVVGDANLFLINPKGIIFGSQATLNVSGAFVASTANAIEFGNQGVFGVTPTDNPNVLTVNPSALLFNQINAITPTIAVQASLATNNAQSIVLLGGNLDIDQAQISAPDGQIELGAVAGTGRIGWNENESFNLSFPENVIRGDIALRNGAYANVTGSGAGNVAITANNISIYDSIIQAGAQTDSSNLQPGNIALNATAGVEIVRSYITNNTLFTVANTGNVLINAASLLVDDGSNIATSNFGVGDAGKVLIQVAGDVAINRFAGVFTNASQGNSGNIQIAANSLSLEDGSLYTQAIQGSSGNIFLNINDAVSFTGQNSIISTSVQSSDDRGGNINVQANSVTLNDNAAIYAVTVDEAGRAGDVTITAKDIVSLANSTIYNDTTGTGDAGDTRISARGLDISNGGNISTSTNGAGNAGRIFVGTTEFVTLSGVNPDKQELATGIVNTTSSGLFTSSEENASGRGGSIQVNTPNLSILDGAVINARTRSAAPGGNITVNAQTVAARGGGQILTTAFNQGRAGNITVDAGNQVVISGSDRTYNARLQQAPERVDNDGAASGFLARVRGTNIADAGEIKVAAPSIFLNNQGTISTATTQGEGGQILLQGRSIFVRNNSQITATAGTQNAGGNGGNIDVASDLFFLVRNSKVDAQAYTGNGGNIRIATQGIFVSPDSQITASSQRGIDGVVEIVTLDSEPSSGLVSLPTQPVDVTNLVAQGCGVNSNNVAINNSEFIIAGRGGLPPTPNESLNANSALVDLGTSLQLQADSIEKQISDEPANIDSQTPLIEAQGWVIGANGEVILTAQAPNVTNRQSMPVACNAQ